MSSKKEISQRINSKLPSEGGDIDLTTLSKENLIALENKIDYLFEQLLSAGEDIVDGLIVKRGESFAKKRLGLEKDGQDLLGKVLQKRLKDGPIINFFKKRIKKRIIGNDESQS